MRAGKKQHAKVAGYMNEVGIERNKCTNMDARYLRSSSDG